MARAFERTDAEARSVRQGERLERLLRTLDGANPFYTRKLHAAGVTPQPPAMPDLVRLPFTTKSELVDDQHRTPPWGTNLTEPLERYTRFNQTSSTTGTPLRWLDTNESWQWMLDCWKSVYAAAHVRPGDRVFFPFSFGPFLGFWTAFEAGCQIGVHCIPAGGMSSQARLAMIHTLQPTVVCCTPTYALRLAEVAETEGIADLRRSAVRVLIVAGEPGGNIPETRRRIEDAWGARVIDHHGLTEVGPVSFECWEEKALHLNEEEYICEVIEPGGARSVADGERGELVITNLGRAASPLIRYRTGDLVVRRSGRCGCGRSLARLEGGILARVDDMVTIRGVNVFPSAIESVVRRFAGVAEYRATVASAGALRELSVEIELMPGAGTQQVPQLASAFKEAIGLTVNVRAVDAGTLPRFEMKARRLVIS